MKLTVSPGGVSAGFDDPNLIGYAGLVPAMRLAEQAGLYRLADDLVHVPTDKGAFAGLKIASLLAGMLAGADSIADMDVIRHGGMDRLFGGWRAPSTLGSFLRQFSFGHSKQVDAVASRFLAGLDHVTPLLGPAQATSPVMVDIDDTVVPVFSARKQGAAIGYTKTRGLDALLVTVSSESFAPVIVGDRLRKGSANSARGATKLIADSLSLLGRTSLDGRQVWLRADSGFCNSEVFTAAAKAGAWVSTAVKLTSPVLRAIATIPDQAWARIEYPQAIPDPDTGELVFAAQVAETRYTAFPTTKHPVPVRLIVRRIPDWQPGETTGQDPMLTGWRFHGFITTVPADRYDTIKADKTHRQHAIIEQVNAALKNSALAHLPSGSFPANTVWLTLTCMAHNLARALAATTRDLAKANPATIRARLIQVPARIATSARRIVLHLPANWTWADPWQAMFTAVNVVT